MAEYCRRGVFLGRSWRLVTQHGCCKSISNTVSNITKLNSCLTPYTYIISSYRLVPGRMTHTTLTLAFVHMLVQNRCPTMILPSISTKVGGKLNRRLGIFKGNRQRSAISPFRSTTKRWYGVRIAVITGAGGSVLRPEIGEYAAAEAEHRAEEREGS